ncbi:hypothetical protein JCM8115_004281 [Rhodotorula mucilaginosa]|nr:hypothetical protein B0A53_06381 [Rhodotorula sp. CCFEE 5036]
MRAVSTVAFVALSACVGQVAARAGPDAHIAHSVRSLERRADTSASSPSSSTFLSDVFQMETPRCSSTCEVSLGDFDSCSQLSSQATIAACACSAQTLGDLRACASCISTTTKSDSNSTAVVNAYNSFVNLCLQEGLVSVTGTVEVGASTKSMARTSFTATASDKASSATASSTSLPASITSTSLATYNPSRAPVSTATVPSLIASGSIASSARAAAASAASAAPVSSTNEKTSGAATSRAVGQAAVAVVALAAGVAFLA